MSNTDTNQNEHEATWLPDLTLLIRAIDEDPQRALYDTFKTAQEKRGIEVLLANGLVVMKTIELSWQNGDEKWVRFLTVTERGYTFAADANKLSDLELRLLQDINNKALPMCFIKYFAERTKAALNRLAGLHYIEYVMETWTTTWSGSDVLGRVYGGSEAPTISEPMATYTADVLEETENAVPGRESSGDVYQYNPPIGPETDTIQQDNWPDGTPISIGDTVTVGKAFEAWYKAGHSGKVPAIQVGEGWTVVRIFEHSLILGYGLRQMEVPRPFVVLLEKDKRG